MLLDTPSIRAMPRNFVRKAKISKIARLNLQADQIRVARFWIRQSRISLAFKYLYKLKLKISQKLHKMSTKMILQTFSIPYTCKVRMFCPLIKSL